MVVRDAIGASIPGAGVGCGIARTALEDLAAAHGGEPFARESLTEDYELGQRIAALGGKGRFVRARSANGRLIATRAYFPEKFRTAVRQKTRWTHGIALQGWDRLGWQGSPVSRWMMLRDRKGPVAAILLALAYGLVGATIVVHTLTHLGVLEPITLSPLLRTLLWINLAGLVWRLLLRGVFTAHEYGWAEGQRAIPRVIVSNVIAICSGYGGVAAYILALRGTPSEWDKTEHSAHPAARLSNEAAR